MCLKNKTDIAMKLKSPRSPRHQMMRQPIKPRLSRRIIKSTKVNLNRYWNKFEEMSASKASLTLMAAVNDNEINDNLQNEWTDTRL